MSELVAKSLLIMFEPVTVENIQILARAVNKSCPLDPISATVFKKVSDSLLSTLTLIVNQLLNSGKVPIELKEAMINTTLKKTSLDKGILNTYRPVLKLPFISQLIRCIVCKQLISNLENNNLSEKEQSAYRQYHSMETALIAVLNDLVSRSEKTVFLVLLDLLAAFDPFDHSLLLNQLKNTIGLWDTAFKWMESYLSECHQYVSVAGSKSSRQQLVWGSLRGRFWGECCSLFTLSLFVTSLESTMCPTIYMQTAHSFTCYLIVESLLQALRPLLSLKPALQKSVSGCLQTGSS